MVAGGCISTHFCIMKQHARLEAGPVCNPQASCLAPNSCQQGPLSKGQKNFCSSTSWGPTVQTRDTEGEMYPDKQFFCAFKCHDDSKIAPGVIETKVELATFCKPVVFLEGITEREYLN